MVAHSDEAEVYHRNSGFVEHLKISQAWNTRGIFQPDKTKENMTMGN